MPSFDSVKVYAYLSGSWTDISDYVMSNTLNGGWGDRSGNPLNRISGVGELRFSLNNSTGLFAPNRGTLMAGWKKGVPIKLEIIYEGDTCIKFRGALEDCQLDAGIYGPRRAHATVLDWLIFTQRYNINNQAILEDQQSEDGIDAIVDGMANQPQNTSYDTGKSTYSYIFDSLTNDTKGYTELNKLALSEPGRVYLKHDAIYGETLVFENAERRNGTRTPTDVPKTIDESGFLLLEDGSFLLLEDGGKLVLDDTTTVSIDNAMVNAGVEDGTNVLNFLTSNAYPKRTDTETVQIYELETPIPIAAGETKIFRVRYADPVGKRKINALEPSDDNVVSLLHCNGFANDPTITDETGKIWTSVGGDVVAYTPIKKFGSSSLYFDGTASYITTPSADDFNFGSGDFTIDWWEYPFSAAVGKASMARDYAATASPFMIGYSDGTVKRCYFSSNGTTYDIVSGLSLGTIVTDTWAHYCVMRIGSNFYAFKDGVLTGTASSSGTIQTSSAVMSVGRQMTTYNTALYDEIRIIKGAGVMNPAGFSVPTSAYNLQGTFIRAFTNSDESGTELTNSVTFTANYYSPGAELSITNGSTLKGYITSIKIFSFGVYSDSPITATEQDEPSILLNGEKNGALEQAYQQDNYAGQAAIRTILERERRPRTVPRSVTMVANRDGETMKAFLYIDQGDMVAIAEDQTGVDSWYYVDGVEFSAQGGADGPIITFTWYLSEAYSLEKNLSGLAVEFDASSTDALNFGYLPQVSADSVTERTFSAWIYLDTVDASLDRSILATYSGDSGFALYIDNHATNRILAFFKRFGSGAGKWTNTNGFALTTQTLVTVTYDHSSANNDPIFYINGVSVSVTEANTPSGSASSELGLDLFMGNWRLNTGVMENPWDGKLKDVRVYNRVLSAADVAGLYAAGVYGTGYTNHLVFQGPVCKTSDLTAFTDLTLTSDDRVLDAYLGAVGIPNGTPITRLP